MPANKTKVLIFSLAYYPYIGGAEIAIQEIAKRLQSEFEFDLIGCRFSSADKPEEKIGNVRVLRVGLGGRLDKYLYPWRALALAVKLHQRNNYKIVWGVMGSYGGLAALMFKRKFPEVKYLLTEQSGDSKWFWLVRTWWWRPWFKKIYQQADFIQVISSYLAKVVRGYGYQGELKIIPNGIDLSWQQMDSILLDKSLSLPPHSKVVLTVSRLVKKNGLEFLIKAMALLPDNYHLLIIGEGPLRGSLQRLVGKLKLKHRVHFLGQIPYHHLPAYYARADVFCRPSLTEGLGNVFLEAMAMRVPVVATPVGGIVDIIKDRENGLLVKVGDPQDIALNLKEAVENEALRQRFIQAGAALVKDKYSWDKIARDMRQIFLDLINSK